MSMSPSGFLGEQLRRAGARSQATSGSTSETEVDGSVTCSMSECDSSCVLNRWLVAGTWPNRTISSPQGKRPISGSVTRTVVRNLPCECQFPLSSQNGPPLSWAPLRFHNVVPGYKTPAKSLLPKDGCLIIVAMG